MYRGLAIKAILTLILLYYISSENQCGYIYRTHKWGQNLQKMGSGYEHFHPKFDSAPLKAKNLFSNIGLTKPNRQYLTLLGGYLGPTNSD